MADAGRHINPNLEKNTNRPKMMETQKIEPACYSNGAAVPHLN